MTFYRLFSIGVVMLVVLFGGSPLWSGLLSPKRADWLVDGRYVVLSPARYQPGSITHFDLQDADPPRNVGFYLLVGDDGRATAIFDRPRCLLEHRREQKVLFNPCTQRAYAIDALLGGGVSETDLHELPVLEDDGRWLVDLRSVLPGYSSIR